MDAANFITNFFIEKEYFAIQLNQKVVNYEHNRTNRRPYRMQSK